MTAVNKGTVQVSKQERMLYGQDWAGLVRRLGDAAQAMEDARSLADEALDESARDDGFTGGERDDKGRSPETVRRLDIVNRVAEAEQAAARLFREVATECAAANKHRREIHPSTCADGGNAPSVVVTNVSGFDGSVLSASGVPGFTSAVVK